MSHKLLLADDSVTIQRVIELTFADEDVQVFAVGDGQQAIDRIEADPPDIVLADVGMPKRNGYEVAAHVKSRPHLAHIPVVLLTGAFEPIDQARATAVGCDGVLAKPFEPQMVINRVKQLLGVPRPAPAQPKVAAGSVPPGPRRLESPQSSEDSALAGSGERSLDTSRPSAAPAAAASVQAPATRNAIEAPVAASSLAVAPHEPGVTLDDYFDRLDAAFANMSPAPSEPAAPETAAPARPSAQASFPSVTDFEWSRPASTPPVSVPSSEAAKGLEAAGRDDDQSTPEEMTKGILGDLGVTTLEPERLRSRLPAETLAPEPVAAESRPVTFAGPPPAEPGAPAEGGRQAAAAAPMADVFAALLDAEQGAASGTMPAAPAPAAAAPAVTEDLIERVAARVLERLSDRIVRETVTDLVSQIAERLVREEIERIKALARKA